MLTVAWAPVALQEIVHHDNIRPLIRSLTGKGTKLGPRDAAGIFGAEFHVLPPWLGGHTRLDSLTRAVVPLSTRYVLIPIVLLVVGRVRSRGATLGFGRAARVDGVALRRGTVVDLARVGGAEGYAFYWRVPIAILVVFVARASAWYRLGLDRRVGTVSRDGRRARVDRRVLVDHAVGADRAVGRGQRGSRRAGDARPAPPRTPARRSVLVRAPDVPLLGLERTVVNELDRSGATVRVDTDLGFQFGYSRTATPSAGRPGLVRGREGAVPERLRGVAGSAVLWATSALPAAQERELRVLQRRLYDELNAAHRMDKFEVVDSSLVGFGLEGIPGVDSAVVSPGATRH